MTEHYKSAKHYCMYQQKNKLTEHYKERNIVAINKTLQMAKHYYSYYLFAEKSIDKTLQRTEHCCNKQNITNGKT